MAAVTANSQLDKVDTLNCENKDSNPKNKKENVIEISQKIITLMNSVDSAHKTPFITSKVQKTHKYDVAKALVRGDSYIHEHLLSMDADELADLYEHITEGLQNSLQAMGNKATFNAVQQIVLGKQPLTTESVVKQAYQALGNVFANTLQDEELRQYHAANADPKLMGRNLEEREFLLCGYPYDQILRNNLPHLQKNKEVAEKFNKALRVQLLRYQNKEISALDLQIRLRYAIAKLAMALEQAGFVAEAMAIRKEHFGAEFAGDGLAGAFVDRNKKNPHKPRPILTTKTKEAAKGYLQKLKESTKDLRSFLGFTKKPVPTELKISEKLHEDVAKFITKLEDYPTNEEARRKLYNRVHNVEQWYNYYQLELTAAMGIPENDAVFKEFPFQKEDLVYAFEKHATKLQQRLQEDDPKSYHPGKKPI